MCPTIVHLEPTGVIVFEVSVTDGATVAAVALNANGLSPPQFAPFPSFAIGGTHGNGTDGGDLLSSGAAMCHGSDKNHLYSFGPGGLASATQPCFTLASGPVYLSWPSSESPTGQSALVASAADSFHLNYNRVGDAGQGAYGSGTLHTRPMGRTEQTRVCLLRQCQRQSWILKLTCL